jgi:hypothetical protein
LKICSSFGSFFSALFSYISCQWGWHIIFLPLLHHQQPLTCRASKSRRFALSTLSLPHDFPSPVEENVGKTAEKVFHPIHSAEYTNVKVFERKSRRSECKYLRFILNMLVVRRKYQRAIWNHQNFLWLRALCFKDDIKIPLDSLGRKDSKSFPSIHVTRASIAGMHAELIAQTKNSPDEPEKTQKRKF